VLATLLATILATLLAWSTPEAHAASARAAPVAPMADLGGAQLQADGQGFVLSLQTSRGVRPRVFRLAHPDRLVIDLPATRRAGNWRWPQAQGSVRAVRGAPQPASYRIVLELAAGLAGEPAWQPDPDGRGLLVQLGTVPAAGSVSTPAPASREPQPVRSVRDEGRDVVVVVDAGHGGKDPGSSGPGGTHEKDVVLPIARALAERLNRQPGMRAVLTRDTDRFIELRERMDKARTARADLFISVHADAVRDHEITGASVYTLSYRGASSEAARFLADRENAAVLKGGVELSSANAELNALLLDVAQGANMGASVEAADQVLRSLDRVGAVHRSEVQHAAFVVLKSPDVPSMLVETAYISNPAEERRLRSAGYQQQLAQAIEAGVLAYFRAHPPDGTLYAAQRKAAPAL
jgi:N-acetylmuramoyl-L-alanine amidase